jgi:hypothetical protein
MSETEGAQVSIVQAIDDRIGGVDEEIRALEAQLDEKRSARERLNGLREEAKSLDGEGGGLPDPAPTPAPAPKPAQSTVPTGSPAGGDRQARVAQLWEPREAQVLDAIRNAGDDGLSPAGIREATGLSKQQVEITIRRLQGKVHAEGTRKSRRYFLAEDGAERPKTAPAPERAASVPARRTHARRDTQAAAAHNALREQVKDVLPKVLEEGPMGKDRATEKVLELVPDADSNVVSSVRRKLLGDGVLEVRANKLQLSGVDRSKPITNVEEEVVACLGSGRTAKEVAANCKLVRDAFSARTILSALVSREVIVQRPDSSPPVYEPRGQLAEAA